MAENTSHTGAPGSPVNEALSKAVRNFSNFKLTRDRYQTQHFGWIEPHLVLEGVSTDVLPVTSSHDLRSYTLTNILMSDIKMHKEYFNINYDAILPKHWQKVFENPTYGSDVRYDVNSCITLEEYFDALRRVWTGVLALLAEIEMDTQNNSVFSILLRNVLFLEMFLSSGSLLRTLGVGFANFFYGLEYLPESVRNNRINFIDWLVDVISSNLSKHDWKLNTYHIEGQDSLQVDKVYYIRKNANKCSGNIITLRDALCIIRENPCFLLTPQTFDEADGYIDDDGYDFMDSVFNVVYGSNSLGDIIKGVLVWPTQPDDEYFNYSRAIAYQLVCAHYFTNDHVDYVYSAELFEQTEASLYQTVLQYKSDTQHSFKYNGLDCYYDTFSGKILGYILSAFAADSDSVVLSPGIFAACAYLTNIFTFRRSLRFRDYFLGGKPTPLALGDTNVAVNDNLVSIIDTTKGIARQRFLNQVNRIGRRIADYITGLWPGAKVEKDIHEPTWLARTDHSVKAIDNENTANEQYELGSSVTSVLRSSDSRYIFECEVGRPGMILGVTYYDVPRAYPYSVDKQVFTGDRFDMFIPQLQFIGDQPISNLELGQISSIPFAYTLRDMQWKQSFDIAIGGFVDALPGWCFLAPVYPEDAHISPDIIRSRPSELDPYYLALTGYSLATYFHFILHITNFVDAKRPMVYAPSIL